MTRHPAFYFLLIGAFILFGVFPVAAKNSIDISADHMEYHPAISTYSAKGSVKVIFDGSTLISDEMRVNRITSDAVATGNVIYESPETVIKGDKMELNLRSKLGTIYNGNIFYKKNNYHIQADNIKKIKKTTFFLDNASITTCDADPPAWKISGRNITIRQHKSLTARDIKFYIKNAPVLYMPYTWIPIIKKRQTGFLFPSFGYSSKRGQYYKQGFFWPVKDNQDITFYVDYYRRKGLAKGLDYRYTLTPGINGEFWLYHIKDQDPSRDLFELKTYHNLELPYNISSYLKLHTVSKFDYYQVMESTSQNRIGFESLATDPFGYASEEKLMKYLESTLHVSRPFNGGRTYLLAQYRQSIEGSSRQIPQNLPEIGLILNTRSKKAFSFNMSFKASNFVKEEGQEGQRLDLNPNFYLSYGRQLNITQRIGLRETAYFLNDPGARENRMFFDSSTNLATRFFKKYSSVIHVIEPAVEYAYIPKLKEIDVPIFDSTDSFARQSRIIYSLTNELRGIESSGLNAKFRLSQSYDFIVSKDRFSPVLAEGSLSSRKVDLSINASYDVYDSIITDTIASLKLKGSKGYIGAGRNYRRSSTLDQIVYMAGINSPLKIAGESIPLGLHGQLWYDLDSETTEKINLRSRYTHQCWGFSVNYTKDPDEYQIMFSIELAGIGGLSSESVRENNSF
jgi:LPS-assembly protein